MRREGRDQELFWGSWAVWDKGNKREELLCWVGILLGLRLGWAQWTSGLLGVPLDPMKGIGARKRRDLGDGILGHGFGPWPIDLGR
ncbi:hypothetical protein Droror1_Dr00022371, partial [Drosera rotundifolia]